ncbi:MAG: alpha-1,2-fucosyltransferase [Planctomycetota bacterium]|nr:MAG: alpha-1,2-fucosyltransferase [Planctomycetota bacterium]
MIVVRLEGGLGNQMFQYAFGWSLARRWGTRLWLDLSSYAARPAHGFLLDRFCIDASALPPTETWRLPHRYRGVAPRGLGKLRCWWPAGRLKRWREKPFGFRDKHLAAPDDSYLVGYWQSSRYFEAVADEVASQFTLRRPLSPASQQVARRMRKCRSVAVHVRRGDYLSDPEAARLYARTPLQYFSSAIEHFASTASGPVEVFVFSNDIPWCRTHLKWPWTTHWVDHNSADSAEEDLVLMAQADACAITNSTFSWWAGWLAERRGGRVYAPSQWFQPGTLDASHIVPAHWIRPLEINRKAA